MKNFSHKLFQFGLIGMLFGFYLFSPSRVLAEIYAPQMNGPHARTRENNDKGICANCHTPHGAKGDKLWILEVPDTFGGTRALCHSCHNSDSRAYDSMCTSGIWWGIKDVFDPEHPYEDHVMHGAAEYETVSWDLKDAFSLQGPYAGLIGEGEIGDYKKGFPVDPNDWDTVPLLEKGKIYNRLNVNYRKGQKDRGMYCGTCHNPHYDVMYAENSAHPYTVPQGGAYLRPGKLETGVGTCDGPDADEHMYANGRREEFCVKCHGHWHMDQHEDCLECHHPHRGMTLLRDVKDEGDNKWVDEKNYLIEIVGRFIFTLPFPDWPPERITGFRATPNVPAITDRIDKDHFFSSLCYACHSEQGAVIGWEDKGATPLFGDDSDNPREHHPMGTAAVLGKIPRAPGIETLINQGEQHLLNYGATEDGVNQGSELYCLSCHIDRRFFMPHKLGSFDEKDIQEALKARANNYLRWDFSNDNPSFCIQCHSHKDIDKLGEPGIGHYQTRESVKALDLGMTRIVTEWDTGKKENVREKVECGNCMFCHFIHDGLNRGDILTPDLDALMRIPPQNLAWADKWTDRDLFDYEDMCYGCHSNSRIVKGPGLLGSKLLPPLNLDPAELTFSGSIRFSHRFATPPLSETTASNIRVGGKFPLSDGWVKKNADDFVEGTINDYGVSPGLMYCGTCHNVHDCRTNPRSAYLRGTRSPYVPMGFCEECHTAPGSTMFIDPLLNHPLGRGPDIITGSTSPVWLPEFVTGLSGEKGGVTFTPSGEPPEVGRVICMTCHSVHNASTTFDGWADQPHSLGGVSAPGNHGNLLVMNNYRDPSGSDMCIRCHPDFSRLVNSPHDFSPGYRPGCQIGQKGACSACHVPHNAASAVTWNGKSVLWARSLAAEEALFQQRVNPAYTLGDTLLCYDCHSRANDDPPLAAYGEFIPQDVALVDGPGGESIGYYEIAPSWLQDIPPYGLKTGGHYIKSPMAGGIMTGDKLACSDCHDPHRGWTRNKHQSQAFIKEWLGGKRNEGFFASLNMAYKDPSHGPRNNTQSRLICINCHGFSYSPSSGTLPTSVPFVAVNPAYGNPGPIASPTPTVFEHSSLGVYACTDCHRHNRMTVFCIDCHAYPPTTIGNGWSGPGDTDENYPGGAGAHRVHVFNCKYDCLTCHAGCLHNAGGATVVNPRFDRSKVSVDFNPLFNFARVIGEYPTKMGYPGLPPLYKAQEQVCFVGCHNPLVADPDLAPKLNNPSPSWSLALKVPTPPTYPSPSLPAWMPLNIPTWMPDPRQDLFYQQLLATQPILPPANLPAIPWPLGPIPIP